MTRLFPSILTCAAFAAALPAAQAEPPRFPVLVPLTGALALEGRLRPLLELCASPWVRGNGGLLERVTGGGQAAPDLASLREGGVVGLARDAS